MFLVLVIEPEGGDMPYFFFVTILAKTFLRFVSSHLVAFTFFPLGILAIFKS